MSFKYDALVLFLALFALYSPVAALSSYLPIVRPYTHAEQVRLALGLVVNVVVFVLLAIWVGEPLLELLGISTAALTATGGIALILASVPLMTGRVGPASATATDKPAKSVLFTPITFPLTVGGTTFAFGVAAAADVGSVTGRLLLSVAALAYAIVTGLTLYAAGHVERRISGAAAAILDRIAGILLTAIAVVLLTNGFTELALSAIDRFQ
ncbi:MarC family protein [Actinoplanes sp. NPDC049596]|uniref:MarC family protein n=1 Tax=unclassified Actinoplanes TaxID=2626549 RepID=UPI0034475399